MNHLLSVYHSIIMAFSTFSRIPMPQIEWKDENMRWMLCAFPFIGSAIGLAFWLWRWVCSAAGLNQTILAAGVTLVPVAIVGGFHLDGFADTLDALASHAEPEKKRAIQKDPRVGSFAVIGLCAYFLMTFALYTQAVSLTNWIGIMTLAHMISRCMSGLATIIFPHSGNNGMLQTMRDGAANARAVVMILCGQWLIYSILLVMLCGFVGLIMVIVTLLIMVYIRFMSRKQFGGMNGDIAGYFLQVNELVMLAVYVVASGVFLI